MLDKAELPEWFSYPFEHRYIVSNGLLDLDIWWIFDGDPAEKGRYEAILERLPKRELVPFAARTDNDICACWERGSGEKVLLIDAFIGSGFEDFGSFDNYWDWFQHAVDEMKAYAIEEKDYIEAKPK